ncbi:HIT domain-containing protein [Wohlfahrtiimonas sp. G9077]|uniref:HIT domain-containing protein n=1 Tax=Wohlfahrtiimonas sp. G9077 TaxID=1980118 RepID=UPI000B985746|nr:HIT domain-containing protein [Wohlfahrtiimonas sp. G9077]OYQ74395.1 HIT family protein [Wohlfahrtiimonas sp. G9077]
MILDARIEQSTFFVAELPLCNVYLQNESRFAWLVLVPRRENVSELIDLSEADQQQAMREMALTSRVMQGLFSPDKLNVANLGNVVKQLHIHVVARFATDVAWPDPIWGKFSAPIVYREAEAAALVKKLQAALIEGL